MMNKPLPFQNLMIKNSDNMPFLSVESISVGTRLLPLSLHCKKGSIVHLIGANGCGKSTLLNTLAMLISNRSEVKGQVLLEGEVINDLSLSDLALKRALLTQTMRPAFNVEVFHYLTLSLPSCAQLKSDITQQAIQYIVEFLQIHHKLHCNVNALSGGEWQRVRLAAVCLQIWPTINPYARLLLLDEPTAALDIKHEVLLYRLIDYIAKQGITVIMANHDLNRTMQHAHQVVLLQQGVMNKTGSVKEVMQPERLSHVFSTPVRQTTLEGQPYLVFE